MVDRIARPRPKVTVTTTSPLSTDDASKGFQYFSLWYNNTTGELFVCVDPTTGSAVWKELTTGSSGGIHVDTVDPTATDDVTKGYQTGSGWLNLTSKTVWISYDDTESDAKWYNYNNLAHHDYVVGPATLARFTTITAAIAQAVADGAGVADPKDVWVLPGIYAESFTLVEGINIHAVEQFPQPLATGALSVEIQGVITINPTVVDILEVSGIRLIGPSGLEPIKFGATTVTKRLNINGCLVQATAADVIDFGSPNPHYHRVVAYKTVFQAGSLGDYHVAVVPYRAELTLKECRAFGGFKIAPTAWADSILLEGGSVIATNTEFAGTIVTDVGYSTHQLTLIDCTADQQPITNDDVTVNGAIVSGFYTRTFGDNGRLLVVGGLQASTFTERPFLTDGDVLRFGGERFQATHLPKKRLDATAAPTVNNDDTQGYSVGSLWVDESTDISYICVDATTGAAVWKTTAPSKETKSNKDMVASVTTADGQLAVSQAIVKTPAQAGYVTVAINGAQVSLGDGAKNKDCYFSNDSGATARAITAIVAGDMLYWMGSIAGFELAPTDKVDFYYEVEA